MFWNIVYTIYPPFLRLLERFHFHTVRQEYVLGNLNSRYTPNDLRQFLFQRGFSKAILAWKDPGEILSLRLVDRKVFQYHLRLFNDGEIRGHYEYSSEGNPLFHILDIGLRREENFFRSLLGAYLS